MTETKSAKPLPPTKPLPDVTDLTRPFWQAGHAGELRMQKCTSCGHIRFPVGPVCTNCLNDGYDWAKLSGRGRVLSHIVFHRAYNPAWKEDVPYSVIMVQLEEGPRMISNLVDPERKHDEDDLVGRDVEAVFDRMADGIGVPRFRLAE